MTFPSGRAETSMGDGGVFRLSYTRSAPISVIGLPSRVQLLDSYRAVSGRRGVSRKRQSGI